MQTILSCAVLLASAAAIAAEDNRPLVSTGVSTELKPRFSAIGGRTVGSGANLLESGIGYPGVHVGFVHGVRNDLDLGGRLTVNAAYEGLAPVLSTGFKGQGLLKLRLLDADRVSLGLELAPGAFVYTVPYYPAVGGVTLPVAVKMGIAATDALGVGLTLETPYWVSFAPLRLPNPNGRGDVVYPAGLYVPILAGGGIEYAVLQNLLVTLDARMGPTFVTANSTAVFTVVAKTGIAWRI